MLLALLAAAICHAGMLAGFPSWENGLPERSRGAGVEAGIEVAAGLGKVEEEVC